MSETPEPSQSAPETAPEATPPAASDPNAPMTPRKALRDIWRIFLFSIVLAVIAALLTPEGKLVPVHITELDNVDGYGTRFDAFSKFPSLLFLLLAGIFFSCRKDPIRSTLGETNRPFYLMTVGFAVLLTIGHIVLVRAAFS